MSDTILLLDNEEEVAKTLLECSFDAVSLRDKMQHYPNFGEWHDYQI